MHHHATFGQNWPHCIKDILIFVFWRWRPYAILDF